MPSPSMVQLFLVESEEMIAALESGLLALEHSPEDPEVLNQVFRAAHTIKGSAGLVNLDKIVEFMHWMENLLELLRSGKLSAGSEIISTLLAALDVLKEMVSLVREEKPIEGIKGYGKELHELRVLVEAHQGAPADRPPGRAEGSMAGSSEQRIYEIQLRFKPDLMQNGQDPNLFVLELADLGQLVDVDVDTTDVPELGRLDPYRLYLRWDIILRTSAPLARLENVFLFVSDENPVAIQDITKTFKAGADTRLAEQNLGDLLVREGYVSEADIKGVLPKQKKLGELLCEAGVVAEEKVVRMLTKQLQARDAQRISSIRVDTAKLDKMVNLVGELVTVVAHVNQLVSLLGESHGPTSSGDEWANSSESLNQITRDIQEQVMAMRMIPIEATFNRFRRVVRDLALEMGKKVELLTEGTETELDKNMIEKLADPITHLIRNCLDHGIEKPAERLGAGKPETATIQLRAMQKEGGIVIEITDDGRGVDLEKVRARALQKGLISPSQTCSEEQLLNFLFAPGFSTAEVVTDLSGRGVGLDVVKGNVESIKGTVAIRSERGVGTKVSLQLPLTLAIIEGMTVQVGRETLTIPLLSIVEQVRPKPHEVKTVEGQGEVIDVRGEYVPMIRLHQLFGFETERTDPTKALVMVCECEGEKGYKKFCLLVDDVIGQQQAVIKSLDENFRKVAGISGATVLGDGRVSLILDVHKIQQMAMQ